MDFEINEQEQEASEYVLGAMMTEPSIIPDIIHVLGSTSDIFKRLDFNLIYQAIITCHDNGGAVDPLLVANKLQENADLRRAGGQDAIYKLQARIVETENISYYAEIVKRGYHRDQLISFGQEIQKRAGEDQEDVISLQHEMQEKLFSIGQNQNRNATVSLKSVADDVIADIDALRKNEKAYNGIPTGFTDFDLLTSGLQPKDLIIIAGRPSMGKTSFILNIASFLAIEMNDPVGVFSLEMANEQIFKRVLAADSKIDFSKIHNGNLDDKEYDRLLKSTNRIKNTLLHIDDTRGMTVQALRAKVRQLKTKQPDLRLIIVDYLQLLRSEGTHRRNMGIVEEISEISRELKSLAGEMEIPVIACSQLNREVERRPDKRPILADLRESGAIEQDADLVAFLYRDEYYDEQTDDQGTAELIIKKQRNGATGTVYLEFVKEQMRFENQTPQPTKKTPNDNDDWV